MLDLQCRVQSGDQALSTCFFIPSGTVDLSRHEQTLNTSCLKRQRQLARVHMIIFYRISRLEDSNVLQAWNCPQENLLHVLGQGGRDTVRIDRRVIQPLGLKKDLVPIPFTETNDLVFDRDGQLLSADPTPF